MRNPRRLFAALLLANLALAVALPARATGRSADVQILSENRDGVLFHYRLPEIVEERALGGGSVLRFDGGALSGETGSPATASRAFLVALPPGAEVSVELGEIRSEETDRYDVAPEPALTDSGVAAAPWDPSLPEGYFPERWFDVGRPSRLRDQTVVEVRLHPVRYDRTTGRTAILREATVWVRFTGGEEAPRAAERRRDPFEAVYRTAILNHRSAPAWRTHPETRARKRADSFPSSDVWYRIEIDERGFYALDYDDLVGTGVLDPRSEIGDARTLRLFTGTGRPLPVALGAPRSEWMDEVAIRVAGEEDGAFDPGDRIEFYALPARGWTGEFDPDADSTDKWFDHPYADRNVYWLTWGGEFAGTPRRWETKSAGEDVASPGAPTLRTFPEIVHSEENTFLDLTRYGSDGWFWDRFTPTEQSRGYYAGAADADSSAPGTLRAHFYHYASAASECGSERVRAFVNGVDLGMDQWNSCDKVCDSVIEVPPNDPVCIRKHIAPHDLVRTGIILREGWNEFAFETSFRSRVYIDWFDVGYERFFRARNGELRFRLPGGDARVPIAGMSGEDRAFDVTDPKGVAELAGLGASGDSLVLFAGAAEARTYHALSDSAWRKPFRVERRTPPDLRSPARGGEYLVIAADEIAPAMAPLEALRAERMTVKSVRLSSIYDQFSWGLPDPVAIRDFLAWAVREWPEGERPAYVLLAGDGTDDFKNRTDVPERNLLPAFYRIDRNGTKTNSYPTDDFFTYLDPDTGGGDWAPDVAIGRLPAQDADEAAALAGKIVAYESSPERGIWRNRLLFLADDHLMYGTSTGYDCSFGLTFTSDTEDLASIPDDRYEREKIYLVRYPPNDSHVKPEAKEAYLRWFAEGHLYSSYTGHGGFDKMADEEVLVLGDAKPEVLANGARLPFFTAWSCDLGRFALRYSDCLPEKMLKMVGAGIVGSVAATEGTFGGVNGALSGSFLRALFPDSGTAGSVGAALAASKVESGANFSSRKLNDEKYVLLGDPAMKLGLAEYEIRLSGADTLALRRGEATTIRGEIVGNDGGRLPSFDGTAELVVRASADTTGFTWIDSFCYGSSPSNPHVTHVGFDLSGTVFHRGEVDVAAGAFEASFFVPLGARVGPLGRIGVYATASDGREAGGGSDSIAVRQEPVDYERSDFAGPSLRLTADGVEYAEGFRTTSKTKFTLVVEDESGVWYDGWSGAYAVTLSIDGGAPIDLSPFFELDRNAYRSGQASFRLPDIVLDSLAGGEHDVRLAAKDGFGNESELALRIDYTAEARSLAFLGEVLNYPNPFDPDRETTDFFVDLTRDAEITIRILTVTGKRIRTLENCRAYGATRLATSPWDGRDEDGDRVANGVYLARVIAETPDGRERAESVGKLVVLRR